MNRLADEPSLYLRQHAENPVDWWPWCAEAFAEARRRDCPVLLSIGYSSCHWCHVMAHESFEDPAIGARMNEHFVCIKVDREERPDVDSVYMGAVQAMSGQGGWPLTAFLLPDGRPFWGGTYLPPTRRRGMPSFDDVLQAVIDSWTRERDTVATAAARLTERLAPAAAAPATGLGPGGGTLPAAAHTLLDMLDPVHGGFEREPKFPPPLAIELLLRAHVRTGDKAMLDAATLTLDRMLWGGMYDQLGGGFHRYSTDGHWLVPHFEKMLYDNAQLVRAYTLAWRLTGAPHYQRCVEETISYMLRELRLPGGAFAASQDADTDGVEGLTYTWTLDQLDEAVGPYDASFAMWHYGVTEDGNHEGTNVLALSSEPDAESWQRLRQVRDRLLAARARRPQPVTDHKAVAAWNGLALAALAEAACAFDRADWLAAAHDLARHLVERQVGRDGTLRRTWHPATTGALAGAPGHDGDTGIGIGTFGPPAFAEDLAAVAFGLLTLADATLEPRWHDAATALADQLVEQFDDTAGGGFFNAPASHDDALAVRPKDIGDHPVPSANSMAATVLARLSRWHPDRAYRDRAEAALSLVVDVVERMPSGLAQAGIAADELTAPSPRELAIVVPAGADVTAAAAPFVAVARATWRPHLLLVAGEEGAHDDHPGLAHRTARDGRPTAYLCTGMTCQEPTTDPAELARQLAALAPVHAADD